MKIFKGFADCDGVGDLDEYADEYSTGVFLPRAWHTLTARFIQSPIAPKQVELSVWDENGDHRESMTLQRVDVLLLEDLVRQIKEFTA